MGQIVKEVTETELIPTIWIRKMVSAWATGGILISWRYTGRLFLSCLSSVHSSEGDCSLPWWTWTGHFFTFPFCPGVALSRAYSPNEWLFLPGLRRALCPSSFSAGTSCEMQLLALVFSLGLIFPFPSQTMTSHFPPWPISFTPAVYNPPLSLFGSLWHWR